MFGASAGGVEWLDPAGRRFDIRSRETGVTNGHAAPIRLGDVGRPGVDEETTRFPSGSGFPSGDQTILTYGSPAPWTDTAPPDTIGMTVLRAYLGYPATGAPAYRVTRVDGRVVLTFGFPDRSFDFLRAVGAPESVVEKFRNAARRTRIVLTILGTITPSAAQRRHLFAIDPSRADEVVRTLAPGVARSAPAPSYWLGPIWNGQPAGNATSTVARHTGGGDSYDIAYGRHPAGWLVGLHITTRPQARNAAGHFVLLSGHGPLGRHGQRIHLADGTPAYFYYEPFPPPLTARTHAGAKVHLSATETSSFSEWSVGGTTVTSTTALPNQPLVIVATSRAQIVIAPSGSMSRAAALRTAEALRPV
ncbi:MAG TPA: hypothetical protein VFW14_19335 [Gaiellales bacterium]|nr:hypothetical protein [Gaiellales bacterium]